jgi:hypothetical protein
LRKAVSEDVRAVHLDRNTSKQIQAAKVGIGKDEGGRGCSIDLRLVGIGLRLAFPLIILVKGRCGD